MEDGSEDDAVGRRESVLVGVLEEFPARRNRPRLEQAPDPGARPALPRRAESLVDGRGVMREVVRVENSAAGPDDLEPPLDAGEIRKNLRDFVGGETEPTRRRERHRRV